MTARDYISHLHLETHPEGGFYKQTYRSDGVISPHCLPDGFTGSRNFSTAIYYLLQKGDFSALHKIRSDECWHFYAGDALFIHVIEPGGMYYKARLGNRLNENEVFQFVVPAGAWFGAEPATTTDFALVGCTVSPGFDFADFELAEKETMLKKFPRHKEVIRRLCRK